MGTAEIQFHSVGPGIFNFPQDVFPVVLVTGNHQGHNHRTVRPFLFDLFDFGKIDLQGTVGDQLIVIEPHHLLSVQIHAAVA